MAISRDLSTVGVIDPPPGVIPNFKNPPSRSGQLLAANLACLIIASLFVTLRAYTHTFLLMSIVFSVCSMLLSRLGLGVHLWDVPLSTFSPSWLKMHMILNAIYPILIWLVKSSILLLYIRVLGTCDRTRNGAIGLIVFTGIYCFAAFIGTIFACTPRRKIWDMSVQGGHCIDIKTMQVTVAALNVVTDVLILLLPMPLVWYFLRVPRRQKIALTAVFMTGSFVCIVSMVRLKEVIAVKHTRDITWAVFDSTLWSIVEANVGIAVACMPTLKLLVRKIFPGALEATTARHRDEISASTGPNGSGSNQSKRKPSRTISTGLTTFGDEEWDEESLEARGKRSAADIPNDGSGGICKPRPSSYSIARWSILALPPRLTLPTKLSDFSDLSGYIRQDEAQADQREREDRIENRSKKHQQHEQQQLPQTEPEPQPQPQPQHQHQPREPA
ncbi:MAG: hypothetical protein M1816_001622 [Peltula sp. TS41687]|nr:MAG: hypothetical protein M1816_001622 [Peltula sp. TS41687]